MGRIKKGTWNKLQLRKDCISVHTVLYTQNLNRIFIYNHIRQIKLDRVCLTTLNFNGLRKEILIHLLDNYVMSLDLGDCDVRGVHAGLGDCDVRGVHAGLGNLFYVHGVVREFYDVHHGLDSYENFFGDKEGPKTDKTIFHTITILLPAKIRIRYRIYSVYIWQEVQDPGRSNPTTLV